MGYVVLDDNNKILKKFINNEKLSDAIHYVIMSDTDMSTEQIKCLYYCKEKETEVLVNI